MTKREKFRDGLIKDVLPCRWADIIEVQNPHGYELYPEMIEDLADDILKYLDSKDCVLKVEGELPINPYEKLREDTGVESFDVQSRAWKSSVIDMLEAGYCLTEPLIGDE